MVRQRWHRIVWPKSGIPKSIKAKSIKARKKRKLDAIALIPASPFGEDVVADAIADGFAALQREDFDGALGCVQGAIARDPDRLGAMILLGRIHQRADRAAAAARAYYWVLERDPLHLETLTYLGGLCVSLDEDGAARQCFLRALALRPGCATAHYNLGLLAERAEDWTTAIAQFEAAAGDPSLGILPWFRLGVVWLRSGNGAQGAAALVEALRRGGDGAEIWANLTYARQELNDLPGAIAAARQALRLQPDNPAYEFSLASTLLMAGQWAEGWERYEGRLKQRHFRLLLDDLPPLWTGEPLPGQTLVVRGEQGLGDTLQFCRYLVQARSRVGRVILKCRPSLQRLLATVAGVDAICGWDEAIAEPVAAGVALLSLPHHCGTDFDTIPAEIPYLSVPEGVTLPLNRPEVDADKPAIGLVWASGYRTLEGHLEHYREKSCPLTILADAFGDQRHLAHWVSLQVGRDAPQWRELDPDLAFSGEDLGDRLVDFAATAAAIAQLDLVISVDTAVAHLAGALGKPVWILLPVNGDWRWLRDRDDSPWYPTARLFRQTARDDWPELAQRVAIALADWHRQWRDQKYPQTQSA
jgi:tetratricopeptide (TPR) repeat protein